MKPYVLSGVALFLVLALSAPCIAFGAVLAVPGMANEKFISSADGSTGPAFTLCLVVWGSLTVFAFVGAAIPIVIGALRTRRARATSCN